MQLITSTKKGLSRKINQDFIMFNDKIIDSESLKEIKITQNKVPLIFQICDGMGGYRNGEESSEFVAKNFYDLIIDLKDINETSIFETLKICHNNLISFSERRHGFPCMGTTIAAIIIHKNELWFVNVGDTQIYALNKVCWRKMSKDHILDKSNPSVLSQCVGGNGKNILKPFILKNQITDFCKLLIMSDGVHLHKENWLKDLNFNNLDFSKEICNVALNEGSDDDMSLTLISL